jgi:hypothetical protein
MLWDNKELFCNTGNGDWALFVDDLFVQEGSEGSLPPELKKQYEDLQSSPEEEE